MSPEVKNFLEVNVELLDTGNFNELFHSAYNGLRIAAQEELVDALHTAQIEIEKDREAVIYYIITRRLEDLTRPVYLDTFISRFLVGILGYEKEWLHNYILQNISEWDEFVVFGQGNNTEYVIFPKVN